VPAGLPAAVRQRAGGMGASLNGGAQGFVFPYEAASYTTTEMGEWLPSIRSPDAEINLYRDRMVARQRDLYRNDGWAKGVIGSILDSTIGATLPPHLQAGLAPPGDVRARASTGVGPRVTARPPPRSGASIPRTSAATATSAAS
jgi:hypothetical protein